MGLHSLRLNFDKWSIATAAAVNERVLAEEEAKKRALLLETAIGSESVDSEEEEEEEETKGEVKGAGALPASGTITQRIGGSKRMLRAQLKQQRQVIASLSCSSCVCAVFDA
jgi:hypothetical protein